MCRQGLGLMILFPQHLIAAICGMQPDSFGHLCKLMWIPVWSVTHKVTAQTVRDKESRFNRLMCWQMASHAPESPCVCQLSSISTAPGRTPLGSMIRHHNIGHHYGRWIVRHLAYNKHLDVWMLNNFISPEQPDAVAQQLKTCGAIRIGRTWLSRDWFLSVQLQHCYFW